MTKVSASNGNGERLKAWASLSLLLPSRGPDCDYWWKLTGRHLASLMEAAGYATERQYEALVFHYHWMVPYMGPAPEADGKLEWPCPLTVEGLPIEYSWKWNTATKRPVVRYTIEAKNRFTGSSMDPLNQDPSRELLHRLQMSVPGVDLTWFNHFLATLYDQDRSKYAQAVAAGAEYTTSIMIAAELEPNGLTTKTYFIPQKVGLSLSDLPVSSLMDAIAGVCPQSAAKSILEEFLTSSGGNLRPTMLAVDNVKPSDSRLKFYFQSPRTNFKSVRNVMTLGGRVPIAETQLQDLRSLLNASSGLPDDYAEDLDLPLAEHFSPPIMDAREEKTLVLPGFGYYFDIAPGREYPEVKIFLRLTAYGQDDTSMGRGISAWMTAHGRGEYCPRYMSALETLVHGRHLSEGKGVHTHVSCLFKKDGTLDITSYLVPEISSQPQMLYRN
uniref:Dimethylallyl tryptophan synthase GliD1 n=1 Tax=Fusarium tricinctum TaxID=61284 RepID=UPI00389B3A79